MSPTAELRFVRRIEPSAHGLRLVKVLQQKWVQHHVPAGQHQAPIEWRDVPLVEEDEA